MPLCRADPVELVVDDIERDIELIAVRFSDQRGEDATDQGTVDVGIQDERLEGDDIYPVRDQVIPDVPEVEDFLIGDIEVFVALHLDTHSLRGEDVERPELGEFEDLRTFADIEPGYGVVRATVGDALNEPEKPLCLPALGDPRLDEMRTRTPDELPLDPVPPIIRPASHVISRRTALSEPSASGIPGWPSL